MIEYKNVIIIGYHEAACTLLDEMISHGFSVKAVVPNKKRDGQDSSWYRDLTNLAVEYSIPVLEVDRLSDPSFLSYIKALNVDVIFSVFSSRIFPPELIEIPNLGCFNFHNADLPKFRGRAAPIWAMIKGEKRIAMTLHWIDSGIDTGNIISKEYVNIASDDDIRRIYLKCNFAQLKILRKYLPLIKSGEIPSFAQEGTSSYFSWVEGKSDVIKLEEMSGGEICNLVRSLTFPFRGAKIIGPHGDINILKVSLSSNSAPHGSRAGTILAISDEHISVQCRDSEIRILDISFKGRHMLAAHYCYLFSLKVGDFFGN